MAYLSLGLVKNFKIEQSAPLSNNEPLCSGHSFEKFGLFGPLVVEHLQVLHRHKHG